MVWAVAEYSTHCTENVYGSQGSVTDDRGAMFEQDGDELTLALLQNVQKVDTSLCALKDVHKLGNCFLIQRHISRSSK